MSMVPPPAGGSACPVWHHQMRDFYLEPAYHHAADRWAVERGGGIRDIECFELEESE